MNTQERALEKAKEKVEALLWESPEGLTISNITGDLRISVPLAKSALKAIGAVYEGGVWVLHDEDHAPVCAQVATKPASQPIEKQETGIPVSEEKQADTSKGIPVDHQPDIDWANAPEGATHYRVRDGHTVWFKENLSGLWDIWDIESAESEGEDWLAVHGTPHLLTKITHPEFDATVSAEQPTPAVIKACTYRNGTYECRGDGYLWDADADGWDPIYKDWPCPACNKEEYDRDMAETEQDEPTPIKSDFALAVEAEREKVLTVIQSGATLARVVELTGLHIDDAQHHVDVLVDLGRVVARPVVVATAYEVVA